MKTKFSTIDIMACVAEMQELIGFRLNNTYDIDNKTYLFKLHNKEAKAVILVESGQRMHRTEYDWPKNPMPSSFTMKLRKHIDNKRLEKLAQLGADRIVDMQFGTNEAAYHVIVELYDKGNIVLTDHEYMIMNVLRPFKDGQDVKIVTKEKYPLDNARSWESGHLTSQQLQDLLVPGESLRKCLISHMLCGPALLDHALLNEKLELNSKVGKEFIVDINFGQLEKAICHTKDILNNIVNNRKGYIIQKREKQPQGEDYCAFNEFHPVLFNQHKESNYVEYDNFNKAVDEFFSRIESQKIDLKAISQKREALKKLDNVRKDHEQRIGALQNAQEEDERKAQLIEINLDLVEQALNSVRSAIASQLSWKEIESLLKEAQARNEPVAQTIYKLNLEGNRMILALRDPYDEEGALQKPAYVEVDLNLSAYANAKWHYNAKRSAAKKEQKTIESSQKAFKNAEKKTTQLLRDVATVTTINKARKIHWFEKFYWFVSSENYIVIAGRDQQQNELIVKRHLRPGDLYVHADMHGATSVIIKNPSGGEVPPKTLTEAGVMAVCYSAAWDAKIPVSAYWVHHDQVSKTAPTGEYLTTGSFMVRGKKNYLPPAVLMMGFGFLFKLDEDSFERHRDERKPRNADLDNSSVSEQQQQDESEVDQEVNLSDSEGDEGEDGHGEKSQEAASPIEETQAVVAETNQDHSPPSSSEDSEEEGSAFPDTLLQLAKDVETRVSLSSSADTKLSEPGASSTVRKPKQKQQKNHTQKKSEGEVESEDIKAYAKQQIKRGQKSKLKKMQKKYKDQDEDEREQAMQLLQSAGPLKETKSKAKERERMEKRQAHQMRSDQARNRAKLNQMTKAERGSNNQEPEEKPDLEQVNEEDEVEEKVRTAEDERVLVSLTALPVTEDTLLFCMSTCAPYSALTNYKYKVKLTPGTGKRGKAAKTALNMFMMDKSTSQREKDLFKSVKDQDIARNIPGKVKLSAPQLNRHKN